MQTTPKTSAFQTPIKPRNLADRPIKGGPFWMSTPCLFFGLFKSIFASGTSKQESRNKQENGTTLWNFFEWAAVLAGEGETMSYECNTCEVAEMTVGSGFEVKDLRNHSPETIETLRGLLARSANVRPDAKRAHFFEIESDTCVFYIYVSPVDGSVALLATWPRIQGAETQARCH
jgi:hypothetical protein